MADTTNSGNPILNSFCSFLSLIPKFIANPFGIKKNEGGKSEKKVDGGGGESKSVDVVKIPKKQSEVPPLKVENDDGQKNSPFFLWQAYALGGILVLRWAWGKWQETKAKAKDDSSGQDQPPATATAPAEDPTPAPAEDPAPAPAEADAPAPAEDSTPAEE